MQSLFIMVLTSSLGFSAYLWASMSLTNPLLFVLIGWAPAVAAYYLTSFWDRCRLWIGNRTFESFIINGDGFIWDGKAFIDDGEPRIFFNDVQCQSEIHKIIHMTGDNDLYIRIIPSRDPDDYEE